MKEPKFFIKISKAYQDDGQWFVQGVASGTLEDRDEEKMSKQVLEKFARSIPLPLTDNHPRDGAVLAELGKVVDAQVLDDEANSLFIKAQLDMDHPAVPYMVKQIQKGKKYAFSVEGLKPMTTTVWSNKLKKMITEYTDVVPKAISITTEPSYTPSFMEVVSKSTKFNLSNENIMAKDKKATEAETEEVKVEEVKTETLEVEVEATNAGEVTTEEVVAEETVEAVEAPTEEEVKTEPEPTEPDVVEVDKAVKEEESVKKEYEGLEPMPMEVEKSEDDREYELLLGLCYKVDLLAAKLESLVASDAEVHSMMGETEKSFKETEKVLKSFHEELEIMKDLPLQKKSRVVSKSYDARAEEKDDKPRTVQDIVKNLL